MMRTAIVVAALAMGGPALAAGHERADLSTKCEPIATLKEQNKDTRFIALTPGQYHFIQGYFVAIPPMSGPPPGDGALLVENEGHGAVVWTRGKDACLTKFGVDAEHVAYMPMPLPKEVLALLKVVKTGKGEMLAVPEKSADPGKCKDDSDECGI